MALSDLRLKDERATVSTARQSSSSQCEVMMYRRQLFSAQHVASVLLIAIIFVTKVPLCSTLEFSYDPGNRMGPQFWPSLFTKSCSLHRQSPISLNQQTSQFARFPPLKFKNYNALPTNGTLTNDGHSVKVAYQFLQPPIMSGGDLPGEYQFAHYHIHFGSNSLQGSEHVLEGVQYPMEIHFVHMKTTVINNVDLALSSPDGIAVFGVFFELGKFDNPILEPLIQNCLLVKHGGNETVFDPKFRLQDFLPLDKSSFYRYLGSLTTPMCDETVIWTVFTSTLTVSERQLAELRKLQNSHGHALADNFRPIQPMYNRVVYRSVLVKLNSVCLVPVICPLIENFIKSLLIVLRALIGFPIMMG